ncbi:MAG: exo-alpha-sialidase [Candidatus Omnitrophica bacterium]|nr:exo-alpha-sialidase [Candidatus Omnitrophota bacterium]
MMKASAICLFLSLLFSPILQPAYSETTRLDWMVEVTQGPDHHAFTDLVRWGDSYYLCFREARSHNAMDGEIHVLRSQDLKKWTLVKVLRTLGDDRDPHFAVKDDELYVFFGVWDLTHGEGHDPVERNSVRSHFSKTSDGKEWTKIQAIYEPGWWLWRVRNLDGKFYSGGYTAIRPKPATRETRLLSSEDGLNWELVSTVTTEHGAGEADMWLNDDGTISMLSRTAENAMLFRSNPEFSEWEGTRLQDIVHAPAVVHWKDRAFVAGRGKGEKGSVTRLWELFEDRVEERLTLPSGGDTSYCGLLVDPESLDQDHPAFFISWYARKIDDRDLTDRGDASSVYVGRIVFNE